MSKENEQISVMSSGQITLDEVDLSANSDSSNESAQRKADEADALRNALAVKVQEVQGRLEQARGNAKAKGSEIPQLRDEAYLGQDPSNMSESQLKDLEGRVRDMDQEVTSHEASQMQEKLGGAIMGIAAIGSIAALIGGAGAMAAVVMKGAENISEGALFTPEVNPGMAVMGQKPLVEIQNTVDR